mmetsp:Transcript_1849/g.2932  ORF Transcript_1849/g.2932 Transcript_1849/m.2932 type:complete len:209 (+) Transcript_1849:2615-3241(+)
MDCRLAYCAQCSPQKMFHPLNQRPFITSRNRSPLGLLMIPSAVVVVRGREECVRYIMFPIACSVHSLIYLCDNPRILPQLHTHLLHQQTVHSGSNRRPVHPRLLIRKIRHTTPAARQITMFPLSMMITFPVIQTRIRAMLVTTCLTILKMTPIRSTLRPRNRIASLTSDLLLVVEVLLHLQFVCGKVIFKYRWEGELYMRMRMIWLPQ